MERVGIDPHAFPAGLTVSHELAVRILRVLPADAGPAAFLTAIREEQQLIRSSGPQVAVPVRAAGDDPLSEGRQGEAEDLSS